MEEGVSPTFATGPVKNQPNSVWKGATVTNLLSRVEIDSNRSRSPPEQPSITLVSTKRIAAGTQHASTHADTGILNFSFQKTGDSSKIKLMRPVLSPSTEATLNIHSQSQIVENAHSMRQKRQRSLDATLSDRNVPAKSLQGSFQEPVCGLIPESPRLCHPFQKRFSLGKLTMTKPSSLGILGRENVEKKPICSVTFAQEDKSPRFPTALQSRATSVLKLERLELLKEGNKHNLPAGVANNIVFKKNELFAKIRSRPRFKLPQTAPIPQCQADETSVGSEIQHDTALKASKPTESSKANTMGLLRAIAARTLRPILLKPAGEEERVGNLKNLVKSSTSNDTDGLFLVKNYNRYDSQKNMLGTLKSHNEGSPRLPADLRDFISSSISKRRTSKDLFVMMNSMKPSERALLEEIMKSDRELSLARNDEELRQVPSFNFHKPYSKLKSGFRSKTPTHNFEESGSNLDADWQAHLARQTSQSGIGSRQLLRIDTNLDLEALGRKCSAQEVQRYFGLSKARSINVEGT